MLLLEFILENAKVTLVIKVTGRQNNYYHAALSKIQ